MPTYEYVCDACGHEFEQFQSITASPLRKCPSCKKLKLKRLIGRGAGVIFKGSGFYETDYRSEAYSKAAKADTEAASKKPSGAEAANGGKTGGGDSSTRKSDPAGSAKGSAKKDASKPSTSKDHKPTAKGDGKS